ncbi:uncharacterized protein LOC123988544 [Osmia bicornis bicornis]|uniref:uncharacterized protein LOC123988544 n=1 Tax=Osmia bicornis bicornis TaxID=1437191 RepID=UPI001EAF1857|nr:uncharacterized protein LOC123988544 [Osmia bicornis bicornis]
MFLLLAFCVLPWDIVQANLDIIFDDAECPITDDEYVKHDSCHLEVNDDSEYGTSLSTYFEIIKDFPDDVRVAAKIYGIHMGEYTNDIGLHVETNFCEVAKEAHTIAAPMIKAVGMTSDNCPPKAGIYGTEHFVVNDEDGLPETFPIGKYLINFTLLNDAIIFANFEIYITVV